MIIYDKEKDVLRSQKACLATWINRTLGVMEVTPKDFTQKLSTGVILCRLANIIQSRKEEYHRFWFTKLPSVRGSSKLKYWEHARPETFYARDNMELFLNWCKKFSVRESLLFESDGLVLQTDIRNVILCLAEVSRIAAKYGVPLPPPVRIRDESPSIIRSNSIDSDSESMSLPSPSLTMSFNHHFPSRTNSNVSPSSVSFGSSSPIPSKSAMRRSGALSKGSSGVERKADRSSRPSLFHEKLEIVFKPLDNAVSPVSMRRSCPSIASASTVCSRMKYAQNSNMKRSASALESNCSNSVHFEKHSSLDQKVLEISRRMRKDVTKVHRISEGLYSFGPKNASLKIVRENNVVVRLGGGWDTLEHYLSKTDRFFMPLNQQRPLTTTRSIRTWNANSRNKTL